MKSINVLDENTINLIAAGEVVERPASVVKELVENAIDAGANTITVEIKKGGIEFIRITDNGSGFYKDDVKTAFLRHATSKIKDAADIISISSMGFRGEALSSIAAVAKVNLVTKRKEDLIGISYSINGGEEGELEEVGAPDGTTIIIQNLFYKTPARRKYLKSEAAEANVINDTMQHLALSRPDISFKYINNSKIIFQTTGNNDIKEIIYRLYGRETSNNCIPINYKDDEYIISGYLGKPSLNRANRNFEIYFINNRYVHSNTISEGIEEGYREFLMQHKFPFCVLHIEMDFTDIDVNVHPAKLEVRFNDNSKLHDCIENAVRNALFSTEMIPALSLTKEIDDRPVYKNIPEQFEYNRIESKAKSSNDNELSEINSSSRNIFVAEFDSETDKDEPLLFQEEINFGSDDNIADDNNIKEDVVNKETPTEYKQLSFIEDEERVLSHKARNRFKIIGQIFDTYWIIEYSDCIYFVDQHAAHEKVNFERMMKRVRANDVHSQNLNPPVVITLSGEELNCYKQNEIYFKKLGFSTEEFGGNELRLNAIPYELYFTKPEDFFLEALNDIINTKTVKTPDIILDKVATMACKASVKGNNKLSINEIEALLDELLTLDNPYNCPHGRPTIFTLSKYELEKKFKRIID